MSHADLARIASTVARRAGLLVLPVAVATLAACASKPVQPAAPVATATTSSSTTTTTPPPAAPAETRTASATSPLAAYLDPNNPVSSRRSVYFHFDDSALTADDKAVVELQGTYLAGHPDLHVRIEGNTDERGGAEYNLALGQRRAQAVATAVEVYGVKPAQVEAVSYGKEKPQATGHDESAWAKNRRADVVYPSR